MGIRPILLNLLLASAFAAADDGVPEFTDRVGTLPLDAVLDSRGNLGGMTVDRLGFVYVANFRDAVWRVGPDGDVKELSRSLYGSSGNAVDSRGDLYQASFFGNTITRITRAGDEAIIIDKGLAGPVGLAFDAGDTLYVCNCNGNTLARAGTDGTASVFAESELFACPNGIALASDGNLYVTNFNSTRILRVTPEGDVSVFVDVPGGAGNAHLVFSKGFFYVTRIIANTVVKISMDGEVLPVAGTGQVGHDDGPGPAATLAHPNGITVSPTGDRLYLNTIVGAYGEPQPAELTIRTIDVVTLTGVLDEAMVTGGLEAAQRAYARFKADPVRGRENTSGEMVRYGYRWLRDVRIPEALVFFRLNAESYPDNAIAQYQLGEALRYAGQADAAAEQYEKALALDPGHALAKSRLAQLGTGS
ncbi:MAG: hypothetical protein R3176_00035 [Woeseiaceae bacterium]|nr:hypothetical protein [Woeseiaceae bacterium]